MLQIGSPSFTYVTPGKLPRTLAALDTLPAVPPDFALKHILPETRILILSQFWSSFCLKISKCIFYMLLNAWQYFIYI